MHDFSLESLGGNAYIPPPSMMGNNVAGGCYPPSGHLPNNVADVHELLAVRAHLDQLEVKESVEAQLQRISVPLSLVLLTMLAYLVAGAVIFCLWENWTFLDSFYFCYISLTTIGGLFWVGGTREKCCILLGSGKKCHMALLCFLK